jgi:hypothetical protein
LRTASPRGRNRFVAVLTLAAAAALCGCAEISQKFAATASQLPGIGLSPDAPERPVDSTYPAVHDMPAPRNSVMLTDIEQQKLEDDLTVARDRQMTSVGLTPVEKKTKTKQQGRAKLIPAASSRSIY